MEELPSVPQMNQDSSLAKSMCQTQSQLEVEGYHEGLQSSYWGQTISRLRWFDSIKKLKSKLTQVISHLSTANSKCRKEKIGMETSWWTCFGFSEHRCSLRWGNIIDCRGSRSADQAQTSRTLLIGRFPWVVSTTPSSFLWPLSDMIDKYPEFYSGKEAERWNPFPLINWIQFYNNISRKSCSVKQTYRPKFCVGKIGGQNKCIKGCSVQRI